MPRRTSRLAWVLLGLTTLMTFAGPILIWLAFRRGEHPAWPPESQEEWFVLLLVVVGFGALLVACVGVAAFQLRRGRREDLGARDLNDLQFGRPSNPNDLRL
jgi:hypothetical protein